MKQQHGEKRRVWRTMWILAALFLLPGSIAYWLFFNPAQWHLGQANKGQLLSPPLEIAEIQATLDDKWLVFLVNKDQCGQSCLQQLDELKRVRMALGRNMYRINQAVLVEHPMPAQKTKQLAELRGLDTRVLVSKTLIKEGVYISDPLGNIMLYYPVASQPDDVYQDLKRLLKISKIG